MHVSVHFAVWDLQAVVEPELIRFERQTELIAQLGFSHAEASQFRDLFIMADEVRTIEYNREREREPFYALSICASMVVFKLAACCPHALVAKCLHAACQVA